MRCALIMFSRFYVLESKTKATAKVQKSFDICKRLTNYLLINGQMLAIIVVDGVNIQGNISYNERFIVLLLSPLLALGHHVFECVLLSLGWVFVLFQEALNHLAHLCLPGLTLVPVNGAVALKLFGELFG